MPFLSFYQSIPVKKYNLPLYCSVLIPVLTPVWRGCRQAFFKLIMRIISGFCADSAVNRTGLASALGHVEGVEILQRARLARIYFNFVCHFFDKEHVLENPCLEFSPTFGK